MGAQMELAKLIEETDIPISKIAKATGLNAELLRRSIRGTRKMTVDEYVILCDYLKSKASIYG